MITLTNGFVQNPAGLIVPNGSIKLQLNVDGTIIAAPYGFVAAEIPVVFQFNAVGQIQPNPPAVAAKIWSNEELQPQLSSTLLGTYYLVTFYDQNGAILNATPLWWQFPESSGATVDISQMTAISTVGGNILYYPTNFAGGTGTVTSVAFVGDGVILSSTPSTPVTVSGNIAATLLTQSNNLVLAGPVVGPAGLPAFRFLVLADMPTGYIWSNLGAASADLTLANTTYNTTFNFTAATNWTLANITPATNSVPQNSPFLIVAGTYWTGSASAADIWSLQNVVGSGTNPSTIFTVTHSGSFGNPAVSIPYPITLGDIQANGGMTSSGQINITNSNSLTFQTSNAATRVLGSISEEITLSLSGTTTDSVTNLLPAGAIIDAVTAYVTQTISGGSTPTTWEAGDATTAARFISTGTALTAGATVVGLNQMKGGVSTDATGPTQATAASLRVTLDQIPGQGKIRFTVFYSQFTPPTS